jgi:hypothetical protein
MQFASVRVSCVILMLCGTLTQNGMLLANPSEFCTTSDANAVIGGIQWAALQTLLLLMIIDAHSTNLRDSKTRRDASVRDEPLSFHWPKLFLYIPSMGTSKPCHQGK